ncbi:hypothetical protein ACHAWF_000120, partial [Thalassiosira exigua]
MDRLEQWTHAPTTLWMLGVPGAFDVPYYDHDERRANARESEAERQEATAGGQARGGGGRLPLGLSRLYDRGGIHVQEAGAGARKPGGPIRERGIRGTRRGRRREGSDARGT